MQSGNLPETGYAQSKQKYIEVVEQSLANCMQILGSNSILDLANIVVLGKDGTQAYQHVISFHDNTCPPEFYTFIEAYANRLTGLLMLMREGVPVISMDGIFVTIENFITDYFQIGNPSISEYDINQVFGLRVGEWVRVIVNGTQVKIQRMF